MRRAVYEVLTEKGLSQRRSCELSGLSRQAARYTSVGEDEALIRPYQGTGSPVPPVWLPAYLGLVSTGRVDCEYQACSSAVETAGVTSAKAKETAEKSR